MPQLDMPYLFKPMEGLPFRNGDEGGGIKGSRWDVAKEGIVGEEEAETDM